MNSGENVRIRVGHMGLLWRSRVEMGRGRSPSSRLGLRLRAGLRSVLAPLLQRYG